MSSDNHLLGGVRAMVQTLYSAALDDRQALGDAQDKVHTAYNIAQDQFIAGALSNLDCSRRNNPWSQSTPQSTLGRSGRLPSLRPAGCCVIHFD